MGIRRNRLTFVGEPDHAGTTPMAWRKDAFLAACEYALKAREHIVRKGSGRSVTNFGRIELAPGVSNIVPAKAVLLQEMRELDPKILARLDRECAALARTDHAPPRPQGGRRGHVPHRSRALRPAGHGRGAGGLRDSSSSATSACRRARATTPRTWPTVTDSGMLFIPSRGGRSHRPDEMSDWKAIERGTNALLHTLLKLAG